MGTSQSTVDFLLDQLSSLSVVRSRKMFGEYALYCDEKVVALVCDNQLFLKITPEGKSMVGHHYAEGQPYPGSKPWMVVGAEFVDDDERLCALVKATADALPEPKPKPAPKPKADPKPRAEPKPKAQPKAKPAPKA